MLTAAILLAATASGFDQVVAAERAFAATSLRKGRHAAFLEFLAPDAIEFGPLPQPARAAHENKPKSSATLSWGPAWVAVSASNDLALSTGPFEFRPEDVEVQGVVLGLFFSVWRRQPDGSWKVAVDSGIGSPIKFAIPAAVTNGSAPKTSGTKPAAAGAEGARFAITSAEQAWAAEAKSGAGDAVAKRMEPEARIYREGQTVGIGPAGARPLISKDKRRLDCKPDRVVASASGDLAYAYGTCAGERDGKPKSYGFLHVWRKQADGSWRILADVTP